MIRNLMASSALAALMMAGGWSAQAANQSTAVQPTVQTGAATASDSTLTPDRPTLATAFIGRSVYTNDQPDADNIGNVDDLIISDDGTIAQAVVGVGGFLGIGEKDVAVPFDKLQVVERDGDIRLIYASTKEDLQNAPAFDRTAYDPRARNANQQAAANAANTNMAPATGAAMGTGALGAAGTDQTAMNAAPAVGTDSTMATPPANGGFMNFNPDQVRASTLIGKDVYAPDNQNIGEVGDLVLQEDGKTRAALIDVGGFLGIGEKRVTIPFDQIKMAADGQNASEPRLTVDMTRQQLEQAPEWKDRTAGNMAVPANGTAANQMATAPDTTGSITPAPAGAADTNGMAADPNAMAPANGGNAADTTVAANQPATGMPADQFVPATQDISADDLIGSSVYGPDDKSLGDVNDVILDKGGMIQAVVVDVGGFLGIGQKPVALQFDAVNVQRNANNGDMRLKVNATQDQLQNAPTYDDNKPVDAQTQTPTK